MKTNLRSKVRFQFQYTHRAIIRDFEFLHSFEKKHEPMYAKHENAFLVHRGVCSRMHTINLDLIMQKGSQIAQMIIALKSFHIIYIFKR